VSAASSSRARGQPRVTGAPYADVIAVVREMELHDVSADSDGRLPQQGVPEKPTIIPDPPVDRQTGQVECRSR